MSNDILNAVQEYMINGHVSDAPLIINDYVITLERLDNGVRISATRGGQTESVVVYDGDLTNLDHSVLSNRDRNDQHPISAITGLQDNLNSKQSVISDLSQIRLNAQKATTAVQPEDLSTVATTGRYSDLDGKPNLATVATTGSYNDLSDKPSMILDHNDLTGRFGYNQHTMSSITGLIDNLNSKQSVISDLSQIRLNAQKATTAVQPEDLSTVATTGSYNDLANQPEIPETLAGLTDDATHRLVTDAEKAAWNAKADATALIDETAERERAAIALQSQIDAIVSRSDVVDVVGTYAELQAYDTSLLGDNDVVKVLSDSTHDNGRSYYRWMAATHDWEYIGTESVGYTKSETDTLLNAKQNTIGDLATIRSGAASGATAVQPGSLAAVATTGQYSDLIRKPSLATVATTGSYNDLSGKPTIPSAVTEQTVSGWGFTKNTGTYSKPSTGIPKTDLASAVQTSLGRADSALQTHQSLAAYRTSAAQDMIDAGKQAAISDLNTIRSNAQSGKAAYDMLDGLEAVLASI